MENNEILVNDAELDSPAVEMENEPHDKNVRLMSPGRMVLRRFFRSKLSVVGLLLLVGLFAFCWIGPLVYTQWASDEADMNGKRTYTESVVEYTGADGETETFYQVIETTEMVNSLAKPTMSHPLGTDKNGYDVLARIMKGGQISLTISFLAVFVVTQISYEPFPCICRQCGTRHAPEICECSTPLPSGKGMGRAWHRSFQGNHGELDYPLQSGLSFSGNRLSSETASEKGYHPL